MQRLGRAEGTAVSCVAGAHDRQVGVQPVGLGGALGDELVAVVAEHLEVLGLPGVAGGWQVVLARGERAIAKASVGSDLPGRRSRRRSRTVSAQGTSRTSRPWSRRSRASPAPRLAAPSTPARVSCPLRSTQASRSPCPSGVLGKVAAASWAPVWSTRQAARGHCCIERSPRATASTSPPKTTDHGHGRVVRPFLGALP